MILALCVVSTTGCNQGGTAPAGSTTFGSPTAAAPSNAYLADLERQSAQAAQLASEQRRQLAYMAAQQNRTNAELLALREQQAREKAAAAELTEAETKALAAQTQDVMGRYDALGARAQNLDRNNRDLYADLAQTQQRILLLEDQNRLLRQRLKDTSGQLTTAMKATEEAEARYKALLTSSRQRSGASISANNSYRRQLTAVTSEGLDVRQDGDLVRIVIPSDQLFEADRATIRADATQRIEQITDVILKSYPRQVIGVEAHTDNTPANGWRSAHQLTATQAISVFEAIGDRQRMLQNQIFVLGHGANYPIASNGTVAGQAQNRRIEVVIYPETAASR